MKCFSIFSRFISSVLKHAVVNIIWRKICLLCVLLNFCLERKYLIVVPEDRDVGWFIEIQRAHFSFETRNILRRPECALIFSESRYKDIFMKVNSCLEFIQSYVICCREKNNNNKLFTRVFIGDLGLKNLANRTKMKKWNLNV